MSSVTWALPKALYPSKWKLTSEKHSQAWAIHPWTPKDALYSLPQSSGSFPPKSRFCRLNSWPWDDPSSQTSKPLPSEQSEELFSHFKSHPVASSLLKLFSPLVKWTKQTTDVKMRNNSNLLCLIMVRVKCGMIKTWLSVLLSRKNISLHCLWHRKVWWRHWGTYLCWQFNQIQCNNKARHGHISLEIARLHRTWIKEQYSGHHVEKNNELEICTAN